MNYLTSLFELLETTGDQVYQLFHKLDPFGSATFPVRWAGEEKSANWFDIGREYSEKWIHQQQIRHTFGDSGILTQEYFYPCLDIFVRGLPHTYREVEARNGAVIRFTITGDGGGEWYLARTNSSWQLMTGQDETADAHATLDSETAWKLFSKAIKNRKEAEPKLQITGERRLGEKILDMVSVMA